MKIRFAAERPEGEFALVLPLAGKGRAGLAALGASAGTVAAGLDRQRFEAESEATAEHFVDVAGTPRRVIIVGAGKEASISGDAAEKIGGTAVARLLTSGEKTAVIDVSGLGLDADGAARVGLGAALRSWRLDVYRTRLKDKLKPTLREVVITGAAEGAQKRYNERWAPVYEGVSLTRELVTEPANIIYPESFVERVRKSLDGIGLEFEVLDRAAMEKLGMGALLGVAQGSVREARMLILKWNGGGDEKPLALVGKGVTFDTGGISIKPAQNMEQMKWDMGGAGGVVGAMKTLALRKAKANVVAICGMVENMPGGNAQRPGDVVTSMSGQTVEVINTDAEGRLVLADAITYVQQKYQPRAIIDFATLTGAILVSLGFEMAGLFSNDDKLAGQLMAASKTSGDSLWRMPMGDAFDRLIDSPIADMKNVGPREGGSITAAQFIQRFVDKGMPWAHIDMANKAWADKATATADKGATGFGVRLIDDYVAEVCER
ncbi:MAG: leucyl aminopeptidase [Sphingomicrobium sp.]